MPPRILAVLLAVLGSIGAIKIAYTADSAQEAEDERTRCATRLALALTGESPSQELLSAPDPQSMTADLLASPAFVDHYARYINSRFNDERGANPAEDASYALAKHVLETGAPWRDLFVGSYRVEATTVDDRPTARVVADANGLGYFRSRPWMVRYAGNEEDGYRLSAAYRIYQNTIGLKVGAVTTTPDQDISATGREAPACRHCHYDAYYALDKTAKILSRRQGEGTEMSFLPPDEGPQTLLDGRSVADDRELVTALVGSTDFRFRTCRLAFEFLYGRAEHSCEASVFDACMEAFEERGAMRDALQVIAEDPGFCTEAEVAP